MIASPNQVVGRLLQYHSMSTLSFIYTSYVLWICDMTITTCIDAMSSYRFNSFVFSLLMIPVSTVASCAAQWEQAAVIHQCYIGDEPSTHTGLVVPRKQHLYSTVQRLRATVEGISMLLAVASGWNISEVHVHSRYFIFWICPPVSIYCYDSLRLLKQNKISLLELAPPTPKRVSLSSLPSYEERLSKESVRAWIWSLTEKEVDQASRAKKNNGQGLHFSASHSPCNSHFCTTLKEH